MKKDYLLHILFCTLICVIEIAFIRGIIDPINSLNIIAMGIIYVLVIKNYQLALSWSLLSGFILDTLYFTPFGLFLATSLVSFITIHALYTSYFTDNSLYSISILFVALIMTQDLLLYIANNLLHVLGSTTSTHYTFIEIVLNELSKLAINLLALAISFYFISFFTNNLKTLFLKPKKVDQF